MKFAGPIFISLLAGLLFAAMAEVKGGDLPRGRVRVELLENVAGGWDFNATKPTASYSAPAFGFPFVPTKYNAKALIIERSNPFLLRAATVVKLSKGEHRLMLRARTLARLRVDGNTIATTGAINRNSSGHEAVPVLPDSLGVDTRMLRPGMQEKLVTFHSPGKAHVFVLEAFVGGKKLRTETAELSVSVSSDGKSFRLLSPNEMVPLTDPGWEKFVRGERARMFAFNKKARAAIGKAEAERWAKRHEVARAMVKKLPVPVSPKAVDQAVLNDVDTFINQRLIKAERQPMPLTDDWQFIRRVALDTARLAEVCPMPDHSSDSSWLVADWQRWSGRG